ncbi:MAG TPA: hypothetical protein VN873_07485 [Candidatus Angelobacter sp.]|nr:hypothetical protein [Candidatus Angelobacter sp.]
MVDKRMVIDALERMTSEIGNVPTLGEELVMVKMPEGYAFYALFPEQYCVTALNWARQNSNESEALVVGIRSIGASLSAVVKETLCQIGWKASRITVRPTGHPFQRQLTLNAIPIARESPVLIVDEGPGISGSSMAAAAEAFMLAGCRNVFFLPGHSNDPGSAGADVMKIWRRIPRYVTPIESVKWNGLSLGESLLAQSEEASERQFEGIQNISGGLWRKLVPQNEIEWPTSPPQFERLKFLCRGRDGSSVLWKFAGLHSAVGGADGCETALVRLSRLATGGYCPKPLGSFRGFVAMQWVEGACLARDDSKDALLVRRIGNYIFDAAGPALAPSQNKIAVERIAEMLRWNTKEALGENFAQKTMGLAEAGWEADIQATYGDGHLAPQEWIRADGTIFKVDAEGHAADHTLIGEQSVLWDIAGAWVEWDLNLERAVPLLEAIEGKGMRVDLEALAFYRAAYAAFRVGLFSLGKSQISDEHGKARFAKARAFYLKQLVGVLSTNPECRLARTR